MHSVSPTRRNFLKFSGITLASTGLTGFADRFPTEHSDEALLRTRLENPFTASTTALALLQAGNLRFQKGKVIWPNQTLARRATVAHKQNPFAIVFSCIDSRVPPELVFDRGLGDLFTIRTGAHVIDRAALGSLEFGVAELNIPLLVVLGHERCGAVTATITAVDTHKDPPGSIKALVDYIRPAVLAAQGTGATRVDNAVRINTTRTVQALRQSTIIDGAIKSGKLAIAGARYDLDTGAVTIIP